MVSTDLIYSVNEMFSVSPNYVSVISGERAELPFSCSDSDEEAELASSISDLIPGRPANEQYPDQLLHPPTDPAHSGRTPHRRSADIGGPSLATRSGRHSSQGWLSRNSGEQIQYVRFYSDRRIFIYIYF